jgi:hypothetical protein
VRLHVQAEDDLREWDAFFHGTSRILGGSGSGNFGHTGRPGEVGGSSTEGGESTKPVGSLIERIKGEDGVAVDLTQGLEGKIHVTLMDTDVEESVGITIIAKDIEQAREKANQIISGTK